MNGFRPNSKDKKERKLRFAFARGYHRVPYPGHSPSAVSADWLVFFAPDAAGNGYGYRAVRAFVFVGRHYADSSRA